MSLPYRVQGYRQGAPSVCGLSEWHTSLASAVEAMLDHQQRPWSSVALVPQVARPLHQEQLSFGLKEEAPHGRL